MKNILQKRKGLVFLCFLVSFSIVSQLNIFPLKIDIIIDEKSFNYENLKLNDNEISIDTPEDRTYTEPMSGYYPASYSFDNDLPGTNPDGFTTTEPTGTYIQVLSELDGHKNVVEINDQNNAAGYPGIKQYSYFPKTYGTIELWLRFNSTTGVLALVSRDTSGDVVALNLRVEAGKWKYSVSGTSYNVPNVADPQANTWYHIRIDFRCQGAPSYLGISEDRYVASINGISSGELEHGNTGMADYQFFDVGSTDTAEMKTWVDAIGFSWDPNYNIGDNLNEGLLLSYDIGINPDWQAYSLDGASNKTILGNTTFSFPSDGDHTIQVFANDSIGTNYESGVRHFFIKSITIFTPYNKSYNAPMTGYYPASYSFDNDLPGTNPDGFTTTEPTGTYIQVLSELDGHKNVVEINDQNNAAGYPGIKQYSFFPKTYGTIELWLRFNSTTGVLALVSRDTSGDVVALNLRVEAGKWKYRVSGISYNVSNVADPQANTWYHIRIDFRCQGAPSYLGISEDRYVATINGTSSGELEHGNAGMADYQFFDVGSTNTAEMKTWVDAIGFSWDPNYNLGDNLNEGLLLSYDIGINPDWQGYSLDGQPNRTILGNTTIPFPSNGGHKIQVFGNDTSGTIFKSNIRYFSIDTASEPQIPGYSLLIMMCIIGIISSILIKNRLKLKI